jgi:Mg-chelatase subunit ChlD
MTNVSNDLTEIAVVLDRSGSMSSIKDDMEGGLWATITEQHGQPGRCRISLYQFDDKWEVVFEGKSSGEITATDCRLVPRGATALHDAVVKSLAAIEARILAEAEVDRPGRVAVVVITDGCENASKENKKKEVQDAIQRATEKFDWKFIFLAADAAGFQDGQNMVNNARGASVAVYSVQDVGGMYRETSRSLTSYRGNSNVVDLHGNVIKSSSADGNGDDPT